MRARPHRFVSLALLLFGSGCSTPGPGAPELIQFRFPVVCEGDYRGHLQGVAIDATGRIFWCHTTELVRTDSKGVVQKRVPVKTHHGDVAWHDGRLFCAVNFGEFNQPAGKADSWVFVYDAETLEELEKHEVPEIVHGAGGIAVRDDRFFVVGGLPDQIPENYVYEYDADFRFVERHVLKSGWTRLGIQTAAFHGGRFYFGCYGSPPQLLTTDDQFGDLSRFAIDASYGVAGIAGDVLLVSPSSGDDKSLLLAARADSAAGLVHLPR